MKIYSFNVNGIRAIRTKGFDEFVKEHDMDILCLQETKIQEHQIDFSYAGYHEYYNSAVKKGYSGTAVLSKIEPLKVTYGIGDSRFDDEGRVITCEFENFYLVNAYVPNSKDKLLRLSEREEYEDLMFKYLNSLDKPVIYTGDMNVAPEEIDLKNPKTNHFNPGFSDEERAKFRKLVSDRFIDTFRTLYPEKIMYSWWSYRANAREKNVGWRIDHFVIDKTLLEKVNDCVIHNEVYGSDHCPIELDINL